MDSNGTPVIIGGECTGRVEAATLPRLEGAMSDVSSIRQQKRRVARVITFGAVLTVFAVMLTVGWNILMVRDYLHLRQLKERIGASHWVLLGFGSLFFALIIVGLILFIIRLVGEIRQNERQQTFIDSITHELKTPIASLSLYLDTLQMRELDPQLRSEFYSTMQNELERLNRVIEEVLQVQTIDGTDRRDRFQPVNLSEIIDECVADVRERHQLTPEQCTWNGTPDVLVSGESELLRIVFRNLLDNAVKYSGERIRIEVSADRPDPKHVLLTVRDEGVGVPHYALDRIFDRFYRAPNDDVRRRSGSGLGLYLAARSVHLHRGKIEAESGGEGHGTTFRVSLPVITEPTTITARVPEMPHA